MGQKAATPGEQHLTLSHQWSPQSLGSQVQAAGSLVNDLIVPILQHPGRQHPLRLPMCQRVNGLHNQDHQIIPPTHRVPQYSSRPIITEYSTSATAYRYPTQRNHYGQLHRTHGTPYSIQLYDGTIITVWPRR